MNYQRHSLLLGAISVAIKQTITQALNARQKYNRSYQTSYYSGSKCHPETQALSICQTLNQSQLKNQRLNHETSIFLNRVVLYVLHLKLQIKKLKLPNSSFKANLFPINAGLLIRIIFN